MKREITQDVLIGFRELDHGTGGGLAYGEFIRKLCARGWLTITWPKEYGGLDGDHVQMLIVLNELDWHNVLLIHAGARMAGPTILLFGIEEQKKEYLPRISRGEIEFTLGYTEPNAGSDLAALETRAVEVDSYYVINGQKLYSSSAHYADYIWLAARTDPSAPRHQGVSLFIVDIKSPGITIRPLWCMGGYRTNAIYFDDVYVPKKDLVGQKNRGFYYIARALDFERMFPTAHLQRALDDLIYYVKATRRTGKALAEDTLVRQKMAEMAADIQVAHLLGFRVAWQLTNGIVPSYESSMLKVYVTELRQRLAKAGLQVLGLYGHLRPSSKLVQLHGNIAQMYFDGFRDTIGGGTSEIQRNIIATRGLQLPRG